MSNAPQYANTPRSATKRSTAANANRDGTGTLIDLLAGAAAPVSGSGPGGTRVDRLRLRYSGANGSSPTGGMLRFFKKDTAGGGVQSPGFLFEVPVQPISPAAGGVAGWYADLTSALYPDLLPVILTPTQTLSFCSETADSYDVTSEGGDFT
jgi:hypothetical protein